MFLSCVPFVFNTNCFFSLVLQFVFAPVFVGVFLSAVVTLEGKPSNVIPKLKQVWIIKSIFFSGIQSFYNLYYFIGVLIESMNWWFFRSGLVQC